MRPPVDTKAIERAVAELGHHVQPQAWAMLEHLLTAPAFQESRLDALALALGGLREYSMQRGGQLAQRVDIALHLIAQARRPALAAAGVPPMVSPWRA